MLWWVECEVKAVWCRWWQAVAGEGKWSGCTGIGARLSNAPCMAREPLVQELCTGRAAVLHRPECRLVTFPLRPGLPLILALQSFNSSGGMGDCVPLAKAILPNGVFKTKKH